MNLNRATSFFALSVLLGLPIVGAASCVAEDLNQYDPPIGVGGYNPGDKPPPGGTTGTGAGMSGQGGSGNAPPMPPMCDDSLKRCDYEFSLPDSGQTSVQVRGSFSLTGWDTGVALLKAGGKWSAVVPIPYNQQVQYKFVIDGNNWITDPTNPDTIDDGFGGKNSLLMATTCDPFTCDEGPPLDSAIEAWRDAVLYFVLVDRFIDGDPSNNGSPIAGVPSAANYHGGDWQGVINKIKEGYFTKLGVNSLWLSVPVDNTEMSGVGTDGKNYSAYHGYWPKDFYKTEERLGTMAKLKELVEEAHKVNITVLIDYAANHVHNSAPVYSQNPGWFWPNSNGNGGNCVCGDGCAWEGGATEKCWFTSYLPDFNYEVAAARKYSIDNMIWWWKETGIDGFRLDALKHMHLSWLTDLRARTNTEIDAVTGKHFYMVGETYTGDKGLIKYYVDPLKKLDGQFDFPQRAEICSKILLRQGSMQELESFLNGNDSYYDKGIMSTFIGNHDLPRVIHLAQDTPLWTDSWDGGKNINWANQPGLPGEQSAFERMAAAFTLLMTTRGVPLIYYGDEIGLPGAGDPDNRRDMQWSGYSAGQNLLKTHLEKLGQIRKDHVALRRGNRSGVWATTDTMAYKMVHPMETVYVAINRGNQQGSVSGLPSGSLTNLLTGQTVTGPTLNLPARSSMILVQ
jgi:glycosidase